MKGFFITSVVILLILLTGSVQAEPTTPVKLPSTDFGDLATTLLSEYGDVDAAGFILNRGIEQSAPDRLPYVDFDCDGEITVNDALMVVPHMGEQAPVSLWAYDLDRDGQIAETDAMIVVAEIGRVDLPTPVWCIFQEDSLVNE